MLRRSLITSALLLTALGVAAGWYFEAEEVSATIGASDLIGDGALYGAIAGSVLGLAFAIAFVRSGFGRLQSLAAFVLIGSAGGALLAHAGNRLLGDSTPALVDMRVKQITRDWHGVDESIELPTRLPDAYYVLVESDAGLVRLHQDHPAPIEVGPQRTVPVEVVAGYWGYPRYRLPAAPPAR